MRSSTDAPDASPFDLPGAGSAAALCLHGLTGTPYEMRPLGEALAAAGIRARGPALPGHNETPDRLARVRHTEWLDAVRGWHEALRREHERVFVVGLSMGGLLSLALAAERPLDAVAVIGTPLRFHHPLARLIPLIRYLHPMPRKRIGSDIEDARARARHPSYDVMPMAAVMETRQLQRRVREGLGRIRSPILVAHGARDRTANPDDSRAIHAQVASSERELWIFEESAHVVPVDRDGPKLAAAVVGFFTRQAGSTGV